MKIGVVSDTHGYLDPALSSLFDGVDEILHAGDVGPAQLLDDLRAIAPVLAVRATFMGLERYNEDLPGEVWLPLGGL